ncbi:nucleotidyltransferase family protein [Anaerocolumna aminovalerica]|uniref:CBS domain-containing protein n=1 Tax=Anaerocolumna aminovalerica TaxID=1527 RepID=A0A1I5DM30_9FIRM|nr:sugar phosphate nucleotidyltransferase [Anaerocolumna aminovalerica]MBU5332235.1 NTP transferase domain-containing protein [Anaerocolumna aminovalerica]SFO00282.1 CBS domain-containing protein [Anaerocolumna aminovalerica]
MNLKDFVVSEDNSVIEVMKAIDKNAKGIAFICENEKLLAVVTDGDIRRYILKNGDLKGAIRNIANYAPKYIYNDVTIDSKALMKEYSITALPIVNKRMKLLSIRFLYDNRNIKNADLNVPVVIMAGGKGTRLYPYTQILPKPLIPIGEKTITELIMDHFEVFGCKHFDMIVNYKKNFIKSFFIDNEHKRDVDFIEETQFLGTGGGLKLLEGRYEDSFFVTNCDILIEEDYSDIMNYHKNEKNIITVVSAMKHVTIPYGTIEVSESGQMVKLNEKPGFSFLTNTGFYVVEPRFLNLIPNDTFIHITDLIQNCINQGEKVGIYPISEHAWMDMGQLEELEKMRERLGSDVRS